VRRGSGTGAAARVAMWVALGTMNVTTHRRNPESTTDGGGR
jgi:hypothetical protein